MTTCIVPKSETILIEMQRFHKYTNFFWWSVFHTDHSSWSKKRTGTRWSTRSEILQKKGWGGDIMSQNSNIRKKSSAYGVTSRSTDIKNVNLHSGLKLDAPNSKDAVTERRRSCKMLSLWRSHSPSPYLLLTVACHTAKMGIENRIVCLSKKPADSSPCTASIQIWIFS